MDRVQQNVRILPAFLVFLGLFALSLNAGAQDALFIDDSGDVGIGTSVPTAPLHLRRDDGTAQVLVTEASGASANRALFSLVNNGGVLFTMTNTATGNLWDFSNRSGGFVITRRGTGGQEVTIEDDGNFYVGPGGVKNFEVRPNGNAILAGTLTEGSSRQLKTDIEPVDSISVRSKLAALPIAKWRYKGAEGFHVGPMAEDFYAAFGLGLGGDTIAPKDLAGVALTVIKSQEAQLREQQKVIAELEARISRIEGGQRPTGYESQGPSSAQSVEASWRH